MKRNKVMLELISGSGSEGPQKRGKKPAGASLAELAGGCSEKEAREVEESVRVFEIAAQAMEHGAELLTSDHHFGQVAGLECTIY